MVLSSYRLSPTAFDRCDGMRRHFTSRTDKGHIEAMTVNSSRLCQLFGVPEQQLVMVLQVVCCVQTGIVTVLPVVQSTRTAIRHVILRFSASVVGIAFSRYFSTPHRMLVAIIAFSRYIHSALSGNEPENLPTKCRFVNEP